MSFFISEAMAETAPAAAAAAGQPPSLLGGLMPLIILFVVFYFLLIRPQAKRAKEHRAMVEALSKGDEVVTQGGLLGKVMEVGDNFIELQLADNVSVKVQRHAVSTLMPKGTIKSL